MSHGRVPGSRNGEADEAQDDPAAPSERPPALHLPTRAVVACEVALSHFLQRGRSSKGNFFDAAAGETEQLVLRHGKRERVGAWQPRI